MNQETYNETQRGLMATAIEKINALGVEEAREDLERIRDVAYDLEEFWDGDGSLGDTDWAGRIDQLIRRAKEDNHE